jgi:hypothetical protein
VALSGAALALFAAKTLKTLLLYPQKVRSGIFGAVIASTAGLALTHTVGKAVLAGIFTSRKPFLRTPKCENPAMLSQVLRQTWQEVTLLSLCTLALIAMAFDRGFDDPASSLWMVMLAIQSMPYAATVITAVLSAVSNANPITEKVLPLPQPAEPSNESSLQEAA